MVYTNMATSTTDESWPPRSARQALLSSPSGRRKYAEFQSGNALSPRKNPATPTLLERLRLARNNQDHMIEQEQGEDEEDEETLQLQLAAIEAKLKLKKLQNKKKDGELPPLPRSSSVASSSATKPPPQVEVALSPTKRPAQLAEQRSPSRISLGIDKGVKGSDVSLRRARTITGSPIKDRRQELQSQRRPTSRSSVTSVGRSRQMPPTAGAKTFSEKMANVRDSEKREAERRETILTKRNNFKVDQMEVDKFKEAAEQSSVPCPGSPSKMLSRKSSNERSDRDQESQIIHKSKTLPDLRAAAQLTKGDSEMFEGFSGLHLSSRILPYSFLQRTLPTDQFKVYRIPDLLKNIVSPAFELPDDVINYVVFGIIASKSSPLDQKSRSEEHVKSSNEKDKKWEDGSQNRKKFMALTLTDLKWTVDLYLFDTAVPRYHRLSPGTVVAVLDPSIMPPKRGREDTGAFSLSLHNSEDVILEIGTSRDLGFCSATKKDGKKCSQWIDGSKTEICEFHLNLQVSKTQSGRMGVNTGTNGYGGGPATQGRKNQYDRASSRSRGGLLAAQSGRGFDFETQSHYFISSSNTGSGMSKTPIYNPDASTAAMLALDADDDPFIAEGQLSRDKGALLQKRMANQQKERDIARKLADTNGGRGAGADYMKRAVDSDTSLTPREQQYQSRLSRNASSLRSNQAFSSGNDDSASHSKLETAADYGIGKKRTAQDISLSPVKKKTRFLTDRGIKVAGRESLGPNVTRFALQNGNHDDHNDNDDDDDDGLDIV